MKKNLLLSSLIAVLIIAVIYFSYSTTNTTSNNANNYATSTQEPSNQNPDNSSTKQYGLVTMRVGETVRYSNMNMTLVRVLDDSRCPANVQCIWVGTVKTEVKLVSDAGVTTSSIELDATITTEKETIKLVSVTPSPVAGKTISPSEYQAVFEVVSLSTSNNSNTNNQQGACFVGGCSGEICSDQEGVVSNCMYKEEFACYKKTSTCKRQGDGKCGWTETEALTMCLKAAIQ